MTKYNYFDLDPAGALDLLNHHSLQLKNFKIVLNTFYMEQIHDITGRVKINKKIFVIYEYTE